MIECIIEAIRQDLAYVGRVLFLISLGVFGVLVMLGWFS